MAENGNFLSFLFGNVDEDGKLENEDLDEELKATLTTSSDLLTKFLKSSVLADEDTSGSGSNAKKQEGTIKPAADAVDFADMNEAAEDEIIEEIKPADNMVIEKEPPLTLTIEPPPNILRPTPVIPKTQTIVNSYSQQLLENLSKDTIVKFSQLLFAPGQYDKPVVKTRATIRKDAYVASSISRVKPSGVANDELSLFNNDILLDELFMKNEQHLDEFAYKNLLQVAEHSRSIEMREKLVDIEELDENQVSSPGEYDEEIKELTRESESEEHAGKQSLLVSVSDTLLHPISITDWESQIKWEENVEKEYYNQEIVPVQKNFNVPDYELLIGDWCNRIEWGESGNMKSSFAVEIPLNDPNLIIDIIYPEDTNNEAKKRLKQPPKRQLLVAGYNDPNQILPHPFNLSNDRFYEVHRLNQRQGKMQRSNFSKSYIEHSLPALQLRMPFFKRYMSKADMRSFHRPPLKLISGEIMKFARIKQLKNRKKMYKGQAIADILQSVEDITLKDNTSFVLFEYSEEYPPLLSNTGMGSLIANYYRKKEDKDPFIPKLPLGIPHILEQVDASPFFMFGQVEPGETVQAIKNNLHIAPVWQHKDRHDDFVLIRFTPKTKKKKNSIIHPKPVCYIREVPKIFTVGQTFPLTLVHPPQSRKMKLFIRDRLKVLALRRIKKRGRSAKYPVHHIVNSFHRYHDQSIRKHLKDFAEVIRGPNNTQYLKVHPSVPVPSEQELFKMCTPEMVCCFESLRVGQQRLADIGYGSQSLNAGDDDATDDIQEDDAQMDDEIQLASWNVTKNFILAAQQKGMVQVYGPGDPTGRGEGFSMFRFSMKEMFVRAGASRDEVEAYFQSQTKTGHKFSITDQQKMYQDELKRVWDSQKKALASDADIELDHDEIRDRSSSQNNENGIDPEEEREWREMIKMYGEEGRGGLQSDSNPGSGAPSPFLNRYENDSQSIISFSSRNLASIKKALLIKRLINGQWLEEVVTDPRVMQPYLKQKRLMELSSGGKNAINILEDDEETVKKKIREELRRLKRESGISKADLIKQAQLKRNEEDGDRLGSSQRKCRSCGQMGHIMTNRICPDFARNYPVKAKKDAASNIKVENGKMIIPTVALQVVEEKIQKEKTRQDRIREKANGPATGVLNSTVSTPIAYEPKSTELLPTIIAMPLPQTFQQTSTQDQTKEPQALSPMIIESIEGTNIDISEPMNIQSTEEISEPMNIQIQIDQAHIVEEKPQAIESSHPVIGLKRTREDGETEDEAE